MDLAVHYSSTVDDIEGTDERELVNENFTIIIEVTVA